MEVVTSMVVYKIELKAQGRPSLAVTAFLCTLAMTAR